MDVFYPADEIEVIRQMLAFLCWSWAACLGWHFANWQLRSFRDFFYFLRSLFHRRL